MKRSAFAALTVGIVVLSCSDQRLSTGPGSVSPAISDGARGGNSGFFWLPPISPDPSNHPNFTPGGFASGLKGGMTVEICELDENPLTDPAAKCAAIVRTFSPAEIEESTADEHYKVVWDTKATTLHDDKYYRISWKYGDLVLGFIDVDVVSRAGDLKNVNTDEFIPLLDGRSLPIMARVEHDAFTGEDLLEQLLDDPESEDFVIAVVPDTRGLPHSISVLTSSLGGGAEFPAGGWLPQSYVDAFGSSASVLFIMERVLFEEGEVVISQDVQCHGNTPYTQFERCYRARTIPELFNDFGPFSQLVTLGMCIELPANDPLREAHVPQLARSDEGDEGPAQLLGNRPAPAGLQCATQTQARLEGSGVRQFASAVAHRVAATLGRWISPRTALAVDLGLGGGSLRMSNFGWLAPVTASKHSGDLQTAPAGSQVAIQVLLTSSHPGSNTPVPGETVTFRLPTGAIAGTAVTNESGIATFNWTIGAGANTIFAEARAAGSPLTFTATGQEISIVIDFDTDPQEAPIEAGTIINSTYASLGVTFTKLGPGTSCGSGPEVYANSNVNPLHTGLSGNVVSVCAEGTASDFSENGFGRVEVNFTFSTSDVCIYAAPVSEGHTAFLEAFSASGAIVGTSTTTSPGTICVSGAGIVGVRFAGQGESFARFDLLSIGISLD